MLPLYTDEALLAECQGFAASGSWSELCSLLRARPDATGRSSTLVTLLSEGLLRTGHPHEARASLREHEPSLTISGDRVAIRRAANLRGAADIELGELTEAAISFARAMELAQRDDDDILVARATNNLAVIANIQGRHDEALSLYSLALPAYQRLGSATGLAESYHNLAITFRDMQQLERADDCELRSMEYARQAADEHLTAIALVGRAELSFRRGDAALAEATARRAAARLAAASDPSRQADALRLCGTARLSLGKLDEAQQSLDTAVMLASTHGSALIEAECRQVRAELAEMRGEWMPALEDAERAALLFERLGATTAFADATRIADRIRGGMH